MFQGSLGRSWWWRLHQGHFKLAQAWCLFLLCSQPIRGLISVLSRVSSVSYPCQVLVIYVKCAIYSILFQVRSATKGSGTFTSHQRSKNMELLREPWAMNAREPFLLCSVVIHSLQLMAGKCFFFRACVGRHKLDWLSSRNVTITQKQKSKLFHVKLWVLTAVRLAMLFV